MKLKPGFSAAYEPTYKVVPPDKDCSSPSAEALRLAREFVDDPDLRAQVKVKIAVDGHPLIADMIDEAVVMAREIIRLAEQTPSAKGISAELLEIIRHNESVDDNGDPVGGKPETSWELGYAAGIRCLYRFLSKAANSSYVGEKK